MCRRSKHMKEIFDKAKELGYVLKSQRNHPRFYHPVTKVTVTTSGSPSCLFATQHAIRDLIKYAKLKE